MMLFRFPCPLTCVNQIGKICFDPTQRPLLESKEKVEVHQVGLSHHFQRLSRGGVEIQRLEFFL